MRNEGKTLSMTAVTTRDVLDAKGGLDRTIGHLDIKKTPLTVRPMQMTAERYYYDALDVYTWRFTINMTVQANGADVYLAQDTTTVATPGFNLVRFMEDNVAVVGGTTVGTYTDMPLSPHGNFVLEDGVVEQATVIVEYTESHMSPDVAYQAVLKHLKYNTDDSAIYKIKSLGTDFETDEIYID
jgi:hypothetical protein